MLRPILIVLAAAFLLTGCGGKDKATALRKTEDGLTRVSVQTDWFPQAEHGGFYQAAARGFYREAGLDVDILPGGPGAQIRLRVSRGTAEFGMLRSDDTAMSIAQGLPLVMVATTQQHDGEALLIHAESHVHDFPDLEGQTVMAPLSMVWPFFLQKKYGISFNLVPTSYGLASFLGDPNLIQTCMLTSEPYFAQQNGATVRTLPLVNADYDAYTAVITRRDLLEREPEVVRAFVAATIRGWVDYIEGDPAPAHALILAANPHMSQGQLDYSRAALIEHALIGGHPERGEAVGAIDLARLQREIDRLLEFNALEKPLRAEEVATLDFLPAELR